MSMLVDYMREREGKEVLEKEYGFASYSIVNEECYIQDIYVDPGLRKAGLASEMADEIAAIAKSRGCKILTGSVLSSANGATDSIKVLLAYGFRLLRSSELGVYFIKDIE